MNLVKRRAYQQHVLIEMDFVFPGTSNMWQASNWQGTGSDGSQATQAGNQSHHPGTQQPPEEFSEMFRMLDQQGQEFNDLSGMFNTFTE